MLWLEMSRDPVHGAGTWGFGQSLWSPSYERGSGRKWPFWETLLRVRSGDLVLHLRGIGQEAAFVGFSTAARDGFETSEHPPNPRQWGYANSFYRVLLEDYTQFPVPISLRKVFSEQEANLRKYFEDNKSRSRTDRRLVFFVIQSGRIQCLNGAYLSEVDDELGSILLGSDYSTRVLETRSKIVDVHTGERVQQLWARVGQKLFSDAVKDNYNYACCFPECPISDSDEDFLIGAHIARWADKPELRGNLDNGLCLCLMHDRAFEIGLFTISKDLRVIVNNELITTLGSLWCKQNLMPYNGKAIRRGAVLPMEEAIRYHWERIGFHP